MKFINNLWPSILLVFISLTFFNQVFSKGLLPIPSDTIIGLYHPFRDLYEKEYPNGIPYKNFLITDPVRQQIPWKKLATDLEKNMELPLWNPYNLSGTPLLANFQSGVFYPFNILFFIFPFQIAWVIFIILQSILSAVFMFFFLKKQRLKDISSVFGAVVFSFSGFFISWFEWGNIISTALWLPLILLSIEYVYEGQRKWIFLLSFSLASSFFAGHLQTFFYIILFSLFYLAYLLIEQKKKVNLINLLLSFFLSLLIVLPQLLATIKLINLSARGVDQNWMTEGWFIPVKHLVQFIVPDFFGNPTTLNYFGTWNYGEMVGFVGIVPLFFVFYPLFYKGKRSLFFLLTIIISIIFATQNPISKLPFALNIPFLSSAQPTRLLFIIDFSLSVLAAFGLNLFITKFNKKNAVISVGIIGMLFIVSYLYLIVGKLEVSDLMVSRRNFYFPLSIFVSTIVCILAYILFRKDKKATFIIVLLFLALTVIDLFRFGWKFTPFTKSEYLFPSTKTLEYLQTRSDKNFRIMVLDSRILPPNFSTYYKIQSIDGYDPLYLMRYGEFISAMERNIPDISPPFGFNRILTPKNLDSRLLPLLNVRYVLSYDKNNSNNLKFIMSEGHTFLYEMNDFLPRAYFVEKVQMTPDKQKTIEVLFNKDTDLNQVAIVEGIDNNKTFTKGASSIISYSENKIQIKTKNEGDGFLVLLDSYYPTWKAKIDGVEANIYRTNFNFRGILVPSGEHVVEFNNELL